MSSRRRDSLHCFRAPGLAGLEVLRLRGAARPGKVGRHAHASLVLCAVHAGVRRLELHDPCSGHVETREAGAGNCCVLEPGRMHTCSWDRDGVADCLCIKPELLGAHGFAAQRMSFPAVIMDETLHALVSCCARAAEADDTGAVRTAFRNILSRLKTHAGTRPACADAESAVAVLRKRLERETALPHGPLRCRDLAQDAGLAPWTLSRAFARQVGAPPRDYVLHLRVQEAKKRLARGEGQAYVALETGFFDQSHLIRRFRQLVGMTPGQYAAAFGPPSD